MTAPAITPPAALPIIDLPACEYRNARPMFLAQGIATVYCDHPSHNDRVRATTCLTCSIAGQQMPENERRRRAGEPCRHRSAEPTRFVPCACPAIQRFPVYHCGRHDAECVGCDAYRERLPSDDEAQDLVCTECGEWEALTTIAAAGC